jgi:hypothetical protein
MAQRNEVRGQRMRPIAIFGIWTSALVIGLVVR